MRWWNNKPVGLDHFMPVTESGCHIWMGAALVSGYGTLKVGGKRKYVHRVAYEHEYGPIRAGHVIDHICRVRRCINPGHLRAVTPRVNATENSASAAAVNAKKTHCKRGHPLAGDNLMLLSNGRGCRECARALWRKHGAAKYQRKKLVGLHGAA